MEAIPALDNQDLLSFSYNGSMWCLQVTLYNVMGKNTIGLINSNIERIEIENALNDLIIKGSLTYVDQLAKVDKLLSEAYSMCIIRFWKKVGEDDNTPFKIGNEKMVFEHMFMIQNISILDRQKNIIKYKIDLISQYWQNSSKRAIYTNYDKEATLTTEIMKTILIDAGFKVDVPSFDENKSNVKLQYITNSNDTPMSSINYLFRRMFYKKDNLEDAIKFLAYNMINDKIYLIDLSKGNSHLASSTIVMSCFDNSIEHMTNLDRIQLASLNKVTKTDFFKSFELHHMYDYDLSTNEIMPISETEIKTESIVSWFQNTFKDTTETHHNKITTTMTEVILEKIDKLKCYWNNDVNIYDEIVQSLLYNDSIVLNVGGQIHQNAGSFVGIKIDRNLKSLIKLDGENARNIEERYKKFEGIWLVVKCRHIIEPMKQKFTTNMTLNRNFTPNITQY